jgi:hypothetical protein
MLQLLLPTQPTAELPFAVVVPVKGRSMKSCVFTVSPTTNPSLMHIRPAACRVWYSLESRSAD